MPSPARGPAGHDVREQIVVAATEYFSLYGYEKTTVSDLAKSIGFSKAYIYKFFESKQAIGEHICGNCLRQIETEVRAAVDAAAQPPEKLRRMFKASVEASLRLFFQDRKLYDIAASAATGRWPTVQAYELAMGALLQDILQQRTHGQLIGLHRRPAPGGGRRGDVVQLAVLEEQPQAGLDAGLEHAPQLLWRLGSGIHRRPDLGFDLAQAVAADMLADGLLGLKELVDIRLGKADGLGQVGHGGLFVAIQAEIFGGGDDDLLAHVVAGRAARGRRHCWMQCGVVHGNSLTRHAKMHNQ